MKSLNKILFVAMRYDYGRIEQGPSFEQANFFRALGRMIPSVVEFDFMTLLQKEGKKRMNAMLVAKAEEENPDLIFFVLYTDEFFPETIRELSQKWTTYNWFCDDHWRFDGFSRHYAPGFTFISTTDSAALHRYEAIGVKSPLLTQWACNHYDYRRSDGPAAFRHEVTFVGQPHGDRKKVIGSLRKSGLPVETFGRGWDTGRVEQDAMITIFNTSKINLNLSNSSSVWWKRTRRPDQIKGRNFEIPGCGGFLLTGDVPELGKYYLPGEEVVTFDSTADLQEKIRHYLLHEDERRRIAERGYQRTIREHTYEHRFRSLFGRMGFAG